MQLIRVCRVRKHASDPAASFHQEGQVDSGAAWEH